MSKMYRMWLFPKVEGGLPAAIPVTVSLCSGEDVADLPYHIERVTKHLASVGITFFQYGITEETRTEVKHIDYNQ